MKNLIVSLLLATLVFGAIILPSRIYADEPTTYSQNTATLEQELRVKQVELIGLLDKLVANLKADYLNILEIKLRGVQMQLVAILQTRIAVLQAELDTMKK